ncbi:MAG: dipeptidase [Chthoniobacterales bacterium]
MPPRQPSPLARAHALLDRVALFDSHNDLAWVIRRDPRAQGDVAAYGLHRRRPGCDTDIPRLRAGKVRAQFWAAFVPTAFPNPARTGLEQIDVIERISQLHPDVFLRATRASDIGRAAHLGRIASFIGVENGAVIENSIAMLRTLYRLGVRSLTLCHNETLDWVDSATDKPKNGGLSEFGREVIREMNHVGMIIDLAHTSPDVMHQVLDISAAPVAITHANARTLCDHPRNTPDDVLVRLRTNGGIIMATFVPDFISQAERDWLRPIEDDTGRLRAGVKLASALRARTREAGPRPHANLAQYCDHLEYLVRVAGIDHVGIGSDFFGGAAPVGLEDVSRFPHIFAKMFRRGWSEGSLAKIAGGNFRRVFRAVERAAAKKSGERV